MTATLVFECPFCQRRTRVPASFAGRRGECPGCARLLEVPAPEAPSRALAPEDDEAPARGDPLPAAKGTLEATSAAPQAGARTARRCPCCGEEVGPGAVLCAACGEPLLTRERPAPSLAVGPRASVGRRLVGFLIDELLLRWIPISVLLALGMLFLLNGRSTEPVGYALLGGGGVWFLALLGYQWFLTMSRGQTIAKRLLKMRIVRLDGTPVDFTRGVVLRNWITGFFAMPFLGWFACVGLLVDGCLVFGAERRCLHDLIAGTIVVDAEGGAEGPG